MAGQRGEGNGKVTSVAVPFFLTIWKARGTTCLYHPHHIGKNWYVDLVENTMWEICFERGAKNIFRLSGEIFRQTEKKGMMCTAYGGTPR